MELPRLTAVYEKFKDRGLEIVAVESSRDTEGAVKFIKENNLSYKLLENGEGDEEVVSSLFGVHSFPTSYLIDGKGRIMRVHVGFDEGDESKLEEEIAGLLEQ